jgi:kynurenine formamidase
MTVIDLTMFMDGQTPIYPGHPEPEIRESATIEKDGWNEKTVFFSSHSSTHIDAPFHMIKNGKKLDEFPPEKFFGKAIVLDVRGQKEIRADLSKVKENDIVLFLTGQSAKSSDYFEDIPVLSRETVEQLIEKKVKMVGIDSPSPDDPPFEMHRLLLRKDILIIENLVNLDKIAGRRFMVYALPLKIKDADGAPCRAIAMLEK